VTGKIPIFIPILIITSIGIAYWVWPEADESSPKGIWLTLENADSIELVFDTITIRSGRGPEKSTLIISQSQKSEIINAIHLVPNERCECVPRRAIRFFRDKDKVIFDVCEHGLNTRYIKNYYTFEMPEQLWKIFLRYNREYEDRANKLSE